MNTRRNRHENQLERFWFLRQSVKNNVNPRLHYTVYAKIGQLKGQQ